jgi:2-keto-4-pentenoate hydratase/2-oxohepta-3-ene-1,7-dioic acid hydratase in catechol pathway
MQVSLNGQEQKTLDGFGAFGPVVATDLDYQDLRVQTLVDGKISTGLPL